MIKLFLTSAIKLYQGVKKALPARRVCVFYPTCSDYALQSIEHYGAFRGGLKSFYRIMRCHPWQKSI